MIQFAGEKPVAAGMASQKHHIPSLQLARQELVRREAKRRAHLDPPFVREALDLVQSRAANDTDSVRVLSYARDLALSRVVEQGCLLRPTA